MEKDLRIIYMGTPDFAVASLKILVENNFNVVAVVTAPDKPSGRGLKLHESPVKEAALAMNLPILQPTNLKDPLFIEELRSYHANLQIVVAFRMLPEMVWNMPEIGTFNLHASLLPQYRGAAPINWAIINGEKETGCTTFFLQHEIDTGDIIFQEKEPILPEDDFESLYNRLMHKGATLVLNTTRAIQHGNIKTSPQVFNQSLRSAPKIHKDTCKIDWSKSAIELENFIRGLSPYPTAHTTINDKNCKIFKAKALPGESKYEGENGKNYTTDHKNYLHFYTGSGLISIEQLQLEGKKRMDIKEFLRGNKL